MIFSSVNIDSSNKFIPSLIKAHETLTTDAVLAFACSSAFPTMPLLKGAVSRHRATKAVIRRRASHGTPSASHEDAPGPGAYVLRARGEQPPSGVEPDEATQPGAQPDTTRDQGSSDEEVVMAESLRENMCRAMGRPKLPCNCALAERFLSREPNSAERRRCCCAFCGIPYGPDAGPGDTRCRNVVPADLVAEYDANYCRLCRGGHCRQHFEWMLTVQETRRVTGRTVDIPMPPLRQVEP